MLALVLSVTWTVLLVSLTVLVTWFCGYRLGRQDGWHAGRRALIREQQRLGNSGSRPPKPVGVWYAGHGFVPFDQDDGGAA